MKASELRLGDRVLVRLDGRERNAVVKAFHSERAGRRTLVRVHVALEPRGELIRITARRIVRRVGRGALVRAHASRASDARTREDG